MTLAVLDAIAGQVSVPCLQGLAFVVGVSDTHHVAIALHTRPRVSVPVLGLIHGAVLGGIDWADINVVNLGAQVNGLVQTAVVVIPPLRQHMNVQRPVQQDLSIR